MTVVRRRLVAAGAATCLAVGGLALSSTSAHAAENAFSLVSTLDGFSQEIAPGAAGSVYVYGTTSAADWTQTHYLQLRTTSSQTDIPLPADGTWPSAMVGDAGRTFLLMDGPLMTHSLYEIVGTTLVPVPLPTRTDGGAFDATDLAFDGRYVYLTGRHAVGTEESVDVARWDGSAWTVATSLDAGISRAGTQILMAEGGTVAIGTPEVGYDGSSQVLTWDGSSWALGDRWFNADTTGATTPWQLGVWTGPSVAQATWWGYTGLFDGPGRCQAPAGSTCVAPDFTVRDGVTLADGSVVLGGIDAATTTGRFALVPSQGATPVSIPGVVGSTVVDLEADADGRTVWAQVNVDGTMTLEQATFTGAATPTPSPTTPAPTAPSTKGPKTPKPTKTPKPPKPTKPAKPTKAPAGPSVTGPAPTALPTAR